MRGKNAFGGCTCCGNTGCAWLQWDVIDATGPNTGNGKLIPSGGGYRDTDGWLLEPGSKLKTATQSPFIKNGQTQVQIVLPVSFIEDLDFSAYGPEEADWKVRVFFESDEAEDNYIFFDLKIVDLAWSLHNDLAFGNLEHARQTVGVDTTRAIRVECGKRVGGVDTVISSMLNDVIAGYAVLSNTLLSLTFALSRIDCDGENYDRGFCFEGYNVVRLNFPHSSGSQNVNRPLTGSPDAGFPINPDRLYGFSPVRQFDGFDPAAGFSETLTDPVGTFAGVQRLGAADIPTYITVFNVGKYEKGFAASLTPGVSEIIYSHPTATLTGPGAAFVEAGSVFGWLKESLTPTFDGTLYGRITLDTLVSANASVILYTDVTLSDVLFAGSIATQGGYLNAPLHNFRIWCDNPSVDGIYDFTLTLSPYPSLDHHCFVWPKGYYAPCSEQALINFAPTVMVSGLGTTTPPAPDFFFSPDPDVVYAPGRVAIVGNWRTGIISDFTQNMYYGTPIAFPPGASDKNVVYRVGVRAFLAGTNSYIPPNKVYDLNEITELSESFGLQTQIPWDFANEIWIPKQPGESGFLAVWVEVLEIARLTQGQSDFRKRYYGLFGAVPVVGDTIDCDGLSIIFSESDKRAYLEQFSPSPADFSGAQFSSVTLDFFSI